MEKINFGCTQLQVSRMGFGCLPLQRLSSEDATNLLHCAFECGVNVYDTAHIYGDSEDKLGLAFAGSMRHNIIIASKTLTTNYATAISHIEESLKRIKTDYIDIYQLHNPQNLNNFMDCDGPFQALLDAKKAGKIRYLGISNHKLANIYTAIDSDVFDCVQYPLSVLSSPEELEMTFVCKERKIGVIAMKAMCGGLLTDGRLPFAFLNQYPHIVPIWGLENKEELYQFHSLYSAPEPYTQAMHNEAEQLKKEHGNNFCRGCGYCMPCPKGIRISTVMRIDSLIKRNPYGSQFTPKRVAEIQQASQCIQCGDCEKKCPYEINIRNIMKIQLYMYLKEYKAYESRHI